MRDTTAHEWGTRILAVRAKDQYRDLSTAQGTVRLFPASVEMTFSLFPFSLFPLVEERRHPSLA